MRKLSKSEAGKLGNIKALETTKQRIKEQIRLYNLDPKLCQQCNTPILYENRKNKFCNVSCSAIFGNKNREWCPTNFRSKSCGTCQTPISTKKYCSVACQKDFEWLQKKGLVIKGEGNSSAVKRYLLEQGHICNCCKNTIWNNVPIPLELEHKDGNSKNNSLDNTELLCPNCHALTPTYKNRNRGNGRASRRKRYAEGKSY